MTRRLRLLLILVMLPACRGGNQSVSPDGREFPHVSGTIDRNAPTMADLSSFTYSGTDVGTVTLKNGVWRGSSGAGGAAAPEVALAKDFRVTGDITSNGREEAVVLLESRPSSRTYLAVVGWIGGQLVNIATTAVDDGIQLQSGRIEPGRLILQGVRRPQGDGAAATPVTVTYALEGTSLRLVSETGRPSGAALD